MMQYNLINKNKIFIAYGKKALQTFFYDNIYGMNYSLDISSENQIDYRPTENHESIKYQ